MAGSYEAATGQLPYSGAEVRRIAGDASSFGARIAGAVKPIPGRNGRQSRRKGVAEVCDFVFNGDSEALRKDARRLRRSLSTLYGFLGEVTWRENVALPDWFVGFAEAYRTLSTAEAKDTGEAVPSVAFSGLLSPLSEKVVSQLKTSNAAVRQMTALSLQCSLRDQLTQQISTLLAPSLFELFTAYRSAVHCADEEGPVNNTGDSVFQGFLRYMRKSGFKLLFLRCPVLARLLSETVADWAETVDELLDRLTLDYTRLTTFFAGMQEAGRLTHVELGVSDKHDHGRTVCVLTFENASRVVYKPRNITVEVTWSKLVSALESNGFPHFAYCPRCLMREGYGWVEFVVSQPCFCINDARRFAYNAGIVQSLLLIVNGVDFHDENVRAVCEMPVLLDLEGLFHPRMRLMHRKGDARRIREREWQLLSNSVLGTGYLPEWLPMIGGVAYGIGGLNHDCGAEVDYQDFHDVNSDRMQVARSRSTKKVPENAAFLNGKPVDIAMFLKEFLSGFRAGYRRVAGEVKLYSAILTKLAATLGLEGRVILRATRLYDMLIKRSVEPSFLRNGATRSLQLEVLRRTRVFGIAPTNWDRIVDAEIAQLERLNIPRLAVKSLGRNLLLPSGEELSNQFSSYTQTLKRRLCTLSSSDLQEQVSLCSVAIQSGSDKARVPHIEARGFEDTCPVRQWRKERVSRFGLRLCDGLVASARCSDGGAVWLGLAPFSWELHSQLRVLDDDLYSGSMGIAIALAAMGHHMERQSFVDLALKAVAPLRTGLRSSKKLKARFGSMPLGIGSGLGSMIYGLTLLSALLDDTELLHLACVASCLVTEKSVAAGRDCDIMQGTAGAILGLLALFEVTSAPNVLECASMCAFHLIQKMSEVGESRSWRLENGDALVGFAHGASGIVYALARLYKHAPDAQLKGAILDGLAYERVCFRAAGGRWPDLRLGRGTTSPCQWCHGAAGIGLARMALMDVMPSKDIAADLESAMQACLDHTADDADHLCCGNFGRIEFLFEAGRRLARNDLVDAARQRLCMRIDAQRPEALRWRSGPIDRNPGFFTGAAGVSYSLLRMLRPDAFPCVLLFDAKVARQQSRR